MAICEYIYCRAPHSDGLAECPVCGHPADRRRLSSPESLAGAEIDGLPSAVIDMHQIVPAFDGVLALQELAERRFGIYKILLQSAPPQARSLSGDGPLLELQRAHPGRYWASFFLDPRHPAAIAGLERLPDLGVRVVKLLPPAGFQPDDPAFDPFWETMQRLGLVAMVHTGFITARHKKEEAKAGAFMSSRFANPLYFDQPARKFPELQIILCHLGGALWYEEAAQMVTQHSNVWADVSGFGLFALRRLLTLGATVDWQKVFWGNDSPPFAYPFNLRLHLAALRDAGAEHLVPGLFHDHARRFAEQHLGLPERAPSSSA